VKGFTAGDVLQGGGVRMRAGKAPCVRLMVNSQNNSKSAIFLSIPNKAERGLSEPPDIEAAFSFKIVPEGRISHSILLNPQPQHRLSESLKYRRSPSFRHSALFLNAEGCASGWSPTP